MRFNKDRHHSKTSIILNRIDNRHGLRRKMSIPLTKYSDDKTEEGDLAGVFSEHDRRKRHLLPLRWECPPQNVLFLSKPDPEILSDKTTAIKHLLKRGLDVYVQEHAFSSVKDSCDALADECPGEVLMFDIDNKTHVEKIHFIIAFGGDGLLMYCNTLFQDEIKIPPVMCFDFGSLGFLAPFLYERFESEVGKLLRGRLYVTLRMRLQCTIIRSDRRCEVYNVLNEAVVDRGPSPFLAMIDIECDQQYLTTVQGDGIILATPTGSTAYSLAAGGSMVHPSVPAILLTPICAHSLSFRPILLPHVSTLMCTVPLDSRSTCWVSFDGKFRQELLKGDQIEVTMSPYPMPTVNNYNLTGDWFDALRSGFMFNQRGARQKGDTI